MSWVVACGSPEDNVACLQDRGQQLGLYPSCRHNFEHKLSNFSCQHYLEIIYMDHISPVSEAIVGQKDRVPK